MTKETSMAVDATAEEIPEGEAPAARQEIVHQSATLAVTPQVGAAELVERLDVIRDAMQTAMKPDVDYGVIPGTNKPTLLKPGSEKLGVLFQLDVQIANEERYGPDDHLTVSSKATVYHAPTGARLGFGQGICTTRERKYAYRTQQRACPECGANAIFKSKARPDGSGGQGWYCWRKKGGCGANFPLDEDQRIVSQPEGEIENPDLPDLWNTVIKMAEKRARIDAVLAVTGASALFTQDMEDSAVAASEQPATASSPVQPDVPGDIPNDFDDPPTCTTEQYQAILTIFGIARDNGLSDEAFIKHLDAIGAPSNDVLGRRITALSVDVADELRGWLETSGEAEAA